MVPNQRKGILNHAKIEMMIKMTFMIFTEVFTRFGDRFELFLIKGEFVTSLITYRPNMGIIIHTVLRLVLMICHFISISAMIIPKPASPKRQKVNLGSCFIISFVKFLAFLNDSCQIPIPIA
jgi:hypothetical protein